MDLKILGIVILYYPDLNNLVSNIECYVNYITDLIIWNNTPLETSNKYSFLFENKKFKNKVIYLGGNSNMGLSKPINYAINMALNGKYDFLLTMDQDSTWINFDYFYNFIKIKANKISIYTPNIWNNIISDFDIVESNRTFMINSGTLYGCEALLKVGKMNELFFVEGIDIEYDIRAKLNNIKIYIVQKAKMLQNANDRRYHKFVFVKFPFCKYNYNRLYEISFSTAYMIKEFPFYYKFKLLKYFFSILGPKQYISILLFEENKRKRLLAPIMGFINAFRVNY